MRDGDSMAEHLNAFNTVVSQLVYVEIKILDEDMLVDRDQWIMLDPGTTPT